MSTTSDRGAGVVSVVLVLTVLALGVFLSAQSKKFAEERNRLHQIAAAARQAKGMDLEDPALWKQYPVSVVQPVAVKKVAPGSSVAVSLTGTFPAGTTVLSERDGVTLAGAAPSARSYSGTITIGPDEPPGFVRLFVYTPVSFGEARVGVAFVDRVYQFDLKSPDGWVVKIVPIEKSFTLSNEDRNALVKYQADYKPGESTPFQTLKATQTFYADIDPTLRVDVSLGDSTASPEAEMDDLSNRLADPKLSDQQRNDLMMKRALLQQKMMQDMMKGLSDPASANKPTDDFGCRALQLDPPAGTAVTGLILCGKNFHDGQLKVTGTMTVVK